ncbi:ElaB/YgaM/YqjD family protein [Chitinimonas naiadis]
MNDTNLNSTTDKKPANPPLVADTDKRANGTQRWKEAAARGKANTEAKPTAQEMFKEDLSSFITEVESLLGQGSSLSAEALAASKAELSERMASVKTQLVDLGERTEEGAEQAVGFAQDYIRNRPLQSVGIALGVGAVVGYLLHRR